MRRLVDRQRLIGFMTALGREARQDARVYLAGGASALLLEWRGSTIDVDLEIRPERDEILRAIPRLKEELEINVELASPGLFIPELPGWEERSVFCDAAWTRLRDTGSAVITWDTVCPNDDPDLSHCPGQVQNKRLVNRVQ